MSAPFNNTLAILAELQSRSASSHNTEESLSIPSVLGERARGDTSDNDDNDDSPDSGDHSESTETPATVTVATATTNENLLSLAQQIGHQKHFDQDDVCRLEEFAGVFAEQIENNNHAKKQRIAKAPWQPSSDLEKNIKCGALTVLLSPRATVYKGNALIDTLLEFVHEHHDDNLPQNIKQRPADLAKLIASLREQLTQNRSKIKKALRASLQPQDPKDKWNIMRLAEHLVKGTMIKPTVTLCARLALMHSLYTHDSDKTDKFWDTLVITLEKMREMACFSKSISTLIGRSDSAESNVVGVDGK
ncbi:hypothetical protein BC835DRAFT_1414198 [Cytidiella melzeri]|nr:hypothetical protein BC835DRAFT_1414198 [Cytidiella melzeri]